MICCILFSVNTVLAYSVIWTFAFIGGAIGTSILSYLWRKEKFPFWSTLSYGMISGGALMVFCLLAPNYLFRQKQDSKYQANILQTGNRSGRKSSCKTPYAIVQIADVEKEIAFPCEYEQNIGQFKKVELDVSKGLWGFYIIKDKRLIK
jgi:hypothetical protein